MKHISRVAVVGMGGFAQDHRSWAHELHNRGIIQHVGQVAPSFDHDVFKTDIADLRARGVATFDSLRQLLAAKRHEIDLVTIPTGIHLHRPMTIASLEAGCHVLVEKPASGSIQDTDAMIRAENNLGLHVTVGYQHMYRDDVAQLKNWVCAGRFGAIRRIKAFGSWPRTLEYYGRNAWAGQFAVDDGWILDAPHQNAMAHAINLMCFLACDRPRDSIRPASIRAELYRANALRTADTVCLRMQTEEGVEVFFAASHCTDKLLNTVFVLETEKATIRLNYDGGGSIQWSDGREEILPTSGLMTTDVLAKAADLAAGRLDTPPAPLTAARAQTLCTCGTFESSAIHDLPRNMCEDLDGAVVVHEMREAVLEAFENTMLFSELSMSWAHAGDEIDLSGYRHYPSYRLPD